MNPRCRTQFSKTWLANLGHFSLPYHRGWGVYGAETEESSPRAPTSYFVPAIP